MYVLMLIGGGLYLAGIIACYIAMFVKGSDKWTGRFFSVFVFGGLLMISCFFWLMLHRG